jgi:hypothetical protein
MAVISASREEAVAGKEPSMRTWMLVSMLAASLLVPAVAGAEAPRPDSDFTSRFRLEDCRFKARGANPYFVLEPGRRLVLEGVDEEGAEVKLLITVLHETRRVTLDIGGRPRQVVTRVVEERETVDGELAEVSRNFFAICDRTNDVYYFGEEVDIYEDGEIVSHEGAWQAGQGGALPGIIMPGTFLLGARYFQEMAPPVATDRAEHVAMGLTVDTPFGTLTDCVHVVETTLLEPGAESTKLYCAGIGLAVDGTLRLTDVVTHARDGGEEND